MKMIESGDLLDSGSIEMVTFSENGLINTGNGNIFSANDKLEILTLEEARAQGLIDDGPIEFASAGASFPTAVTVNPPIIEEENSSDNLPAIGHLDGYEIQTASDGTLLPSTVNAKMADGTYRRLTLFPQVVDGNVTCVVQFENENELAQTQDDSRLTSISDKIDNIICRNEDIISNSKMTHLRNNHMPKASKLRRVEKPKRDTPLLNMSRKGAFYFPIKEAVEPIYRSRFKDVLTKVPNFRKRPILPQLSPSKLLGQNIQTSQTNKKISSSSSREEDPSKNLVSLPQTSSNFKKPDGAEIFVKTNPVLTKSKNPHPLGSTENPITLIQNGHIYVSNQSLTEAQLQQVSAILKKERAKITEKDEQNFVIDPETKSKIVYSVVYPDEDKRQSEDPKTQQGSSGKRIRSKISAKEVDLTKESKEGDDTGELKEVAHEQTLCATIEPPKTIKLPRTRSGRLSRPPRYMVQDFKRLQINGNSTSIVPEADLYEDYKNPEPDEPLASANPELITDLSAIPKVKRKKQFKSKYRCPTCQKIYLGHNRMMLHLRKFPDHSNLDEYADICERALSERKVRSINLSKLKKVLNGVDKTSYGPLLAKAFSIWDFILLKISTSNPTGAEEVDNLLKELLALLEKVKKVSEELLVPVYDTEKDSDSLYIDLDKIEVSHLLGMVPGTYQVKRDKLHLLRLANEEPPPPPPPPPLPRPTQLATKFEPNLSTKLLDCSNDSIDMDCSSKDVESGDEKKEWHGPDFSEFLQNQLPAECSDGLALWKSNEEVQVSTPPAPPETSNDLTLWKEGKSAEQPIWKDNAESSWKTNKGSVSDMWKGAVEQLSSWREGEANGVVQEAQGWTKDSTTTDQPASDAVSKISKESENSNNWAKKVDDSWDGNEKEGKKDWLRQWKEDAGVPGMRSTRLTSTPEAHVAPPNALFSPPLRRNSVSSFALNPQEELLGLDLHDLFDDLMPDQSKARRPKPTSIDSIINEAFFTGTPNEPAHTSLPQLIPGPLDEVAHLDFLNHD